MDVGQWAITKAYLEQKHAIKQPIAQGLHLNNFGGGPLDDALYQI